MHIRPAKNDEARALSDLAFRSKAYWGYDTVFMEACRRDLTIQPSDCDAELVGVAMDEATDTPAGFYRLYGHAQLTMGKLADLFVEPTYIGTGLGRELFDSVLIHARRIGYTALAIHSDPHAEAFYLHMGAKRVGAVSSGSIAGRELPLLIIQTELSQAESFKT